MFCSGHRRRTGTAAAARLNPRAPSCPTGTRPAVKCSSQPSHRQGPLPCGGLDLRLSEGTFAIRDDHTRLSGQRGKMGSFSPKPPTARAQTVWISFRSYPNNLNNHQARFLLAPAVASGCSETNTNPICSQRVILEARDKLHPLQCCCQRPGSDPSNSPPTVPGAGCPLPEIPLGRPCRSHLGASCSGSAKRSELPMFPSWGEAVATRALPGHRRGGCRQWCHHPSPQPLLVPNHHPEHPGMKAHVETRDWHPEPCVTSLVPAVGWESGHSWQILIGLQLYLDEK